MKRCCGRKAELRPFTFLARALQSPVVTFVRCSTVSNGHFFESGGGVGAAHMDSTTLNVLCKLVELYLMAGEDIMQTLHPTPSS